MAISVLLQCLDVAANAVHCYVDVAKLTVVAGFELRLHVSEWPLVRLVLRNYGHLPTLGLPSVSKGVLPRGCNYFY